MSEFQNERETTPMDHLRATIGRKFHCTIQYQREKHNLRRYLTNVLSTLGCYIGGRHRSGHIAPMEATQMSLPYLQIFPCDTFGGGTDSTI
jgi:hypothetical protein